MKAWESIAKSKDHFGLYDDLLRKYFLWDTEIKTRKSKTYYNLLFNILFK